MLAIFPMSFQGQEEKIMAYQQETIQKVEEESLFIVQKNTLKGVSNPKEPVPEYRVKERIWVIMTAYSSSVWETQGDPFITASGTRVHWGTVAANFLPFGTKIRIPTVFGDQIFTVEDRMNPRKKIQIDIWHPSRIEALRFGVKEGYIEILEEI
jgi:3D (Asp-Asp-Asp) domain-containing protein